MNRTDHSHEQSTTPQGGAVILCQELADELTQCIHQGAYDKIFLLTDRNTHTHCLPLIEHLPFIREATEITIEAGDSHKSIEQVVKIWELLSKEGASRHSLLINLGGGMVTDLGGFAGASFKRGIHNINIPTTLMASVDAAIGGKTGINFNGLKNEIGAFYLPEVVLIDCRFLQTLDRDNFLSGYAEMIKHGLIHSQEVLHETLAYPLERQAEELASLIALVERSVKIKAEIVAEDPTEQGLRKSLNFGHTIAHAIESDSFKQNRPLLHGHAVAVGLVCELYLSYKHCGLPIEVVRETTQFIKSHYPAVLIDCNAYESLYQLMTHDKKNQAGKIRFALLSEVGIIRLDQELTKEAIFESLDFYRENLGI